ncbi:hypothetical protein BSL78_06941, partial [Apostichopus japonicus]
MFSVLSFNFPSTSPHRPFIYYVYVSIQVWDTGLALEAQQWLEECRAEYPLARSKIYTNVGHNLFIDYPDCSGTDPPTPVTKPVSSWYNEGNDYDYDSNSCPNGCDNYTQQVWANTEKVGCGIKYCEEATTNRGTTYQNVWIVACNYSPRGNIVREKPYITGDPCSQCPPGKLCRNGLC